MSCWSQTHIKFIVNQRLSVTDIEKLIGHIQSWNDMEYQYKITKY